jgi:hypothetical protein
MIRFNSYNSRQKKPLNIVSGNLFQPVFFNSCNSCFKIRVSTLPRPYLLFCKEYNLRIFPEPQHIAALLWRQVQM